MQSIRSFEHEYAAPVGFGTRNMLLSAEGRDGAMTRHLAGLGGQVECFADLSSGVADLKDAPFAYGLLVVDCDSFGGLDAARRVCCNLDGHAERVPVVLISRECQTQVFPMNRNAPVVLRAPLSAVSMRVGFEHALRDQLAQRMI